MRWLSIAGLALFAFTGLANAADREPARLLLISQGPDGHPWNTHEFRAGIRILHRMLADVPNLEVTTADAHENPRDLPSKIDSADGVVLFVSEGAKWVDSDPQRRAALQRLAARQGGITALHWAVGTRDAKHIDAGRSLWGGVHGGPDRKYTVARNRLTPNTDHPITAGLEPLTIRDEWYYRLKFAGEGTVTPLWTTTIDDEPQTVAWAWDRPDGGRSFGFVGLHFHQNWGEETYRRFVTRGVLWTIGLERYNSNLELEFDRKDLAEPRPMPTKKNE